MAGWREQHHNAATNAGIDPVLRREPGSVPPGFTPEQWLNLLSQPSTTEAVGLATQALMTPFDDGLSKEIGRGEGTWFGEGGVVDPRDLNEQHDFQLNSRADFIARRTSVTKRDWTRAPKH